MTLPLLLTAALAYDAIPYPDCTGAEYFDISSLTCNTCPTGQKPDTSGLSCQCDDGILQYQDPSTATDAVGGWQCISCAFLGFAATRDGTHCMACTNSSGTPGTTLGFDAATGDCACPDGEALVERDGLGALLPNKMCLPCPATSILNSDGLCEPCPAEKMESQIVATLEGGFETVCKCVAGYEEKFLQQGWWGRDYYCLEQTAREELRGFEKYKVTFNDLLGAGTTEVDSHIFDQLLMPSAVNCLRAVQASDGAPREQPLLQGNEACQALGNLCVLQMYDEDSAACELYRKMQAASNVEVNEEEQWKARLPALYYEPGPAVYTLNNVPLVVALDGPGSRLAYVLASYSLNGTYLGLTELSTELQLCTGVAKDPTAFRQFGVGVKVECELKLDQLLATKEPTFYDLYLQVDGEQLYPIPVQLYNLRVDARRVNVPEESVISLQNDQLVRRFFAVDAASGREQGGDALPAVLRYVKMAELRITIIENLPSSIYPPKLMLEYAEVQVPSTADDTAEAAAAALNVGLPSSFIAKYSMDMNNTTYVLSILFVISLVLWIIGWLVQMYLWSRRNQGGGGIDGAWIVKAISQLCRVFSDVFFWLVFGACGWMYCLFKNQDEVFVMMPPDDYLYPFRAFLCCTFGAKCLWVLDLVYSQAHHDVFFVDWEQPRGQQGDDKLPVSVWRSVFVANEWVRLQTSRAVSVEFNLLFLLFLMRGLDQEMYATEIPNDIGSPGVTPNPVLRYALSSFMLLVMSLCQWLFRWAIWDRFIEDRVWQFVDLLSTTNISCFLMEEKYYGHYLHGKSVHSHADSDMLDFNKNLKREQDQLCAKRGLQEDSDMQTFNIFLSRAVRENFDSIYERRSGLPGPKRGVDEKGRPRGFRAGPDEALERKREVNKFISSFVMQTEKQHKLEIRHKEYYERLVGLPPELGYSSRSVFLEDPRGLFKQMLLAGREYDLVLLSVLTYGMFDMIFEDTFIAIFATYLLDLAVRFLRRELAKKNIAAKTLIDDRLLL